MSWGTMKGVCVTQKNAKNFQSRHISNNIHNKNKQSMKLSYLMVNFKQ